MLLDVYASRVTLGTSRITTGAVLELLLEDTVELLSESFAELLLDDEQQQPLAVKSTELPLDDA